MRMNAKPLLYRLTPSDPAGHYFSVELNIDTPHADGQQLSLPAWIPGSYLIRDFARHIVDICASSGKKAVAIEKVSNHSWQCAPCKGPLQVRYTVYAWDLSVRGAHFDETHAFFNGTSVFLKPHGLEHLDCLLDLQMPTHRVDWRVYTSLPEASTSLYTNAAKRHGFGLYHAANYDALIDHPVEMGTPQFAHFKAHGAEHELVFTGVVPNLDLERIASDVQKICEAQIAFFEPDDLAAPFLDSSNRYVFMTMVTGDGYGGLEHRASTALMTSRADLPVRSQTAAPDGYTTFLGLVSHEYFHTWNVKRIKPAAFAPYQLEKENHTRLLWVAEGFTSYYDDLMLLRAGVIDEEKYFSLVAKSIDTVSKAPGRLKQSVADSSFDAWTRFYKQDENAPNALVSYYSKGALIALGLDLLLRNQSGGQRSLDDVMRLLWSRYGREFYRGQQCGIPEGAMPELILEATGIDTSDFLKRHVDQCNDVPLQALLGDAGITLEPLTASATHSIDARTRMNQGRLELASVYNGGAAHKAGLSAGDQLVAINGLRIVETADLDRALKTYTTKDTLTVHVFRRDELREFQLCPSPATPGWTLKRKQ